MRDARGWLLLATLLAAAAMPVSVLGQDARVRTDVDTTLVTVGDRIHLTIAVEHVAGARILWPDSLDLSPFEVLSAEAEPPQAQGDRVVSGAVLTLTAFELGELEIPSFDLEVVGPGEQSEIVSTDRFGIEVVSVGADEGGDIRDIRGPLMLPVSVITVSGWLLVLLVAALLAYWLYRRWSGREEDGAPVAGPPPRPAHEVALESLARIEASPLLGRGEVKEYHIRVSETLRRYVEDRFGVPALEMTTREVTEGLRRASVAEPFRNGLRRFLDQCDMVKFAKVRPTLDASHAVLNLGRTLVQESIPEPEPSLSEAEIVPTVAADATRVAVPELHDDRPASTGGPAAPSGEAS